MKRQLEGLLFSLAILTAVFTPVGAQQDGGPSVVLVGRPSNVPSTYRPTPSGWFHPDCIISMTEDEKIAPDGSIADRATGAFVRAVSPCQYPQYDANGNTVVTGNDGIRPPAHSWIVDGQAGVGDMDFISANWTVPPNPGGSGQTLYFFPAFLPPSEDQLLQPVLG